MANKRPARGKVRLVAAPLVIFLLLLALMVFGLNNDPREIPSVLIGRDAPQTTLPQLQTGELVSLNQRMLGQAWVLNIWASWCVACREEHPVLMVMHDQYQHIPLIGLNYKDKREEALAWLQHFQDPFLFSVEDTDGRTGIEFGVYGVPETFVIDAEGKIAFKHIGPLTMQNLQQDILPFFEETP